MYGKRLVLKKAKPQYVYALDPRKDKNPNLFYLNPVTLTAANTFNISETQLPIPRNMYQKNKATVIEILKVSFKIRMSNNLYPYNNTSATTKTGARLQIGLSTRNLQLQQNGSIIQNATDTANIAEKVIWVPASVSAIPESFDFEVDLQSKDGYGVVCAVDKLYTYFVASDNVTLVDGTNTPAAWTGTQGYITVITQITYRHINVNTQAFIGAVQQLQ